MYLTERLVGVFSYAILLFIVYLIVTLSKREQLGKILFLYTIILSVMAFFFVPNQGSDLYKQLPFMHSYEQSSLKEIWNLMLESSSPVAILYVYIIGKTNIDGLLPAITAFLFFTNVFNIVKRSALKYNAESKDTALVLLFFMSTGIFIEVISGIRSMLAFSIIAVCFYKEIYENKLIIKNLLWYLIAAFLHTAAMGVVIIRVLFLLIQWSKNTKRNILNILVIAICGAFLFAEGNKYFISMWEKGYGYYTQGSYSYLWEYIIGGIDLISIIIIQITAYRCIKKDNTNVSENYIFKFSCLISIVILGFCSEYNTFHRFVIFNSIIAIPMLVNVLQNKHFAKRKKAYLKLTIYITSFVILFLACARGNLSSLKFFLI